MELIYFSLAIITILLAHGIRIYRWKQFICIYEKPNDANLLAALAIGYFLNFLFCRENYEKWKDTGINYGDSG